MTADGAVPGTVSVAVTVRRGRVLTSPATKVPLIHMFLSCNVLVYYEQMRQESIRKTFKSSPMVSHWQHLPDDIFAWVLTFVDWKTQWMCVEPVSHRWRDSCRATGVPCCRLFPPRAR
jgi:hypothetical protein